MAASSKNYELIFLLRAQLDASMQQFSVAQGHIRELEEEIQRYNNTLKNIDAYRQQTQAVEKQTDDRASASGGGTCRDHPELQRRDC